MEIMWGPQSNLEERVNPSFLKDDFSLRTDTSIFTSIEPVLLDQSNETSGIFPALKSTSYYLPQPQYLIDQIQVQKPIQVIATDQMQIRIESTIISIDSNITDNIFREAINV